MPERLDPEQQALAERTHSFVRETLEPLSRRLATDPDALRQEIVAAAREEGFFAMTQPRSHGGTEASVVDLTVVREALASSGLAARRHVFGPAPGFLADADGALARDYLDPMLRGEKRSAFAFTDDRSGPPTTARRVHGGWSLTGSKGYVTGGADADFFGVLARVEAGEGSLFAIVDATADGLAISEPFSSLDGSHHAALRFEDVFVPDSHLLGAPGEGMPRAMRQIGDTRLAIAADACGLMRCVLDHLESHLKAPHSSGRPVGDREGVRLRFADLRIDGYAARSMLYRTARLAERGENVVNEGIATKVFATEALSRIVDGAIQLEGGGALIEGHLLAGLYREVRALRLAEGASDVLRQNLARGRLELDMGRL